MGHLLILTPITIILALLMHKAYKKNPENHTTRIFRNFFSVWVICSAIMGAMAMFIGTTLAIGLSLAFGVPFLYLASALLVWLPFILYRKYLVVAKILSIVIALWAIVFGVIIYVNVTGMLDSIGPLSGLFAHVFNNIAYYHLFGLSIIFVPLGIFFFREASKSSLKQSRVQATLIGVGLIIGGVSESFHAFVINPTWFDIVDFGVPIGWLLIIIAILYPKIATDVAYRIRPQLNNQ